MSRDPQRARGGAAARPARGAAPGAGVRGAGSGHGAIEPLAAGHPAARFAMAIAFLCVLITVSFPLYEYDFWEHLLVGRAIWTLHAVPHTQIWTWPTYGAPAITPSWGFRVLIHPLWAAAGVWGLFAWRWLATLAAFALLLATARRQGARGLAPGLAMVAGGLLWWARSQIRPETLVAILMAAELWILETRRQGGRDHTPWLVPLAWLWINAHISYHLGFAILGVYVLDAWRGGGTAPSAAEAAPRTGPFAWWNTLPAAARLALIGVVALAATLLNPYGARALWEPFDFFLHQRHEPIYVTIGELQPIHWHEHVRDMAGVFVFLWPALIALRTLRRRFDLAETLLAALFITLGVTSVRFLGFLAIVGTPFLARDLAQALEAVRLPRALAAPWTRAGLAAAAMVALAFPQWRAMPPQVGIQWKSYPVRACDFMAEHGVRGRGFNYFTEGGYLLWRFWPDRTRLPFMDIHQAGTPALRQLYTFAQERRNSWNELDARYRFEWTLLTRHTFDTNRLADFLDADPTWTLVFQDDIAMLFVRRGGALDSVARRYAYQVAPSGNARLAALLPEMQRSPELRARFRGDLERMERESPWNSQAHWLLANLDIIEERWSTAADELRRALAVDPTNVTFRNKLDELGGATR